MRCSKCGAELSEDTKFCSYCGHKIETTPPPPPPPIEEDSAIPEIPREELSKENGKKADASKSSADKIKEKATEKRSKLSTYGKITTIAIIVFALLCLMAFLFGKTAAGIIAILQVVLTVVALLMKKQVIRAPKSWLHMIALALAVVLLVPYIGLFKVNYGDAEKFKWSDILLADVVPEPESLFGEVIGNSDEHLSLYVYKTSAADYSEYVDACKEKGFTVEADQSEQSYYAYDSVGYKLSLYYDESDSKMHIGVDAAKQYGTLTWPDSVIARMLPVPTSTTGEITQDDETGFHAYVGNTPIDEFKAYVAACADMGFNVDVYDSDESYSAENSDGYKLSVSYQGNGVISISVDEPEYEVDIEIKCVKNLIFSTYDVDVYVDGSFQGTISHGSTESYNLTMTKGIYEIKFVSAEDGEVTGTVSIEIYQDESLQYKISCTSSQINVETIVGTVSEHGEDEAPIPQSASSYKFDDYEDVQKELADAGFTNISFEILYDIVLGWTDEGEIESISVDGKTDFDQGDIFKKNAPIVITYHMKEEDDPNKSAETSTPSNEQPEPEHTKEPQSVSYSTNTSDTVKDGNCGVYAYKRNPGLYDIYYIIDFDEGYVYYFCDGNGDETCDKVKIDSGDLNSVVLITYHDGNTTWQEGLHFKWARQPDHLIFEDGNHFEWDFYSTNLSSALALRNTKTIVEY